MSSEYLLLGYPQDRNIFFPNSYALVVFIGYHAVLPWRGAQEGMALFLNYGVNLGVGSQPPFLTELPGSQTFYTINKTHKK